LKCLQQRIESDYEKHGEHDWLKNSAECTMFISIKWKEPEKITPQSKLYCLERADDIDELGSIDDAMPHTIYLKFEP